MKDPPKDNLDNVRNKVNGNDPATTAATKPLAMDDQWVHDPDGNVSDFKEPVVYSIREDNVGDNDKWETYMPTNDVCSHDIFSMQ